MQPRAMRQAWRQDQKRRANKGTGPQWGDRDRSFTEGQLTEGYTVGTETAAPPRHVRVTVEGHMHYCLDSHGKPTRAVRVRYQGEDREASTLLLLGPGVTVEDVTPSYVWTDGDVVLIALQSGSSVVLSRHLGEWEAPGRGGHCYADDSVTTYVTGTSLSGITGTVLRYQAGEGE